MKILSQLGLGKARARIDASLLGRVVSNLLNNSLEAMDGVGQILVTSGMSGEFLYLKISDSGKGMPPEVIALAGKVEISQCKQGFGLGLSHAVRTIKDLGGDVMIESEMGRGTSITILLLAET